MSIPYVQESRMCWRMDEFKVDPWHIWKDWSAMLRYKRAKAGYKKEKKHIAGRVTCRLRRIRPYRGGLFCPGIPFNATHRESSPLHFSLPFSLLLSRCYRFALIAKDDSDTAKNFPLYSLYSLTFDLLVKNDFGIVPREEWKGFVSFYIGSWGSYKIKRR